jgi:uncharacterized protein with HEPN domain
VTGVQTCALPILKDIEQAIIRIRDYTDELTYEQFVEDTKTQDAVVRNLEIVGEASKNMSDWFKTSFPQLNWRGLAGLRDRLIHHYFGVNIDIIWTIISTELHGILDRIGEVLKEASPPSDE